MFGALVFLLSVAGFIAAIVLPPWMSEYVERQFISRMSASFDGSVTVSSMHVTLFPEVQVNGQGLVLRRRGDEDQPPLIEIERFGAHTSLAAVLRGRIRLLEVRGLRIFIPPDSDDDNPGGVTKGKEAAGQRAATQATGAAVPGGATKASDSAVPGGAPEVQDVSDTRPRASGRGGAVEKLKGLTIAEILCTNAVLTIAPDEPDGTAQIFDITRVRLEHFAVDRSASYDANLINPRPRGPIVTQGEFGPWNRQMPRLTPLSGTYVMTAADMSVFKGIGGALTSNGRFSGILKSIDVTGTSTMSDFTVDVGSHPMRLDTSFDARVDGTNGNTYLNRVDATLGQSPLSAKGEIAGTPGVDGKRIRLDVVSNGGRLEDFVYLVLAEKVSPVSGRITLHTKLDLPPGDIPVPERIRLDGSFTIQGGRFANPAVQDKIDELSRRGQGKPTSTEIDDVASTFSAKYSLRNGVLSLPQLGFKISGAEVAVGGRYMLRGAALDFKGHLRLAVPLSKTTTGFKSWLLKVVDPFFKKNGAGAEIPIKLGGTAHEPAFGLDIKGL